MRSTVGVVAGLLLLSSAVCAQQPQAAQGARGGGRGARPAPSARIITFEARPSSIKPGESTQLVWATENPAGLTIEPGIGAVTPRGSKQLKPAATTTYTLTMRGPNDTPVTSSITVTVAGTTPVAAGSAANVTAV